MKTILNGLYASMMLGLMFMLIRGVFNYKVNGLSFSHVDIALMIGFAFGAIAVYVFGNQETA